MRLLYVILFGILGVLARYYMGMAVTKSVSTPFPLGTFLINIIGAFVIGVIYVLGVERSAISEDLRIGIMVGLLGGYTTFSSYALEAARLLEQGEFSVSAFYFFLSPILGLLATFGGLFLARTFMGGSSV